jgi:FAD/FMN-containing dehydrogenase
VSIDVQALSDVSGRVLTPGDEGYDDACKIHNALIERSPAVIVRCRDAADAAAAIRFARDSGLDITVRGGGHNVAGRCIADGALMIDLAEMKNAVVNAEARTVRAEGGMTWAELNDANAAHGLAVTGGAISTTGIAGLTLGGGLGWLMAKYGLAADNLLAVELVTADGEILDVTADSHPDLFWALLGWRRQLRRSDDVHLQAASARDRCRRPDRPSDRRCRRDAPVLPGCRLSLSGRPDGVRRARLRA